MTKQNYAHGNLINRAEQEFCDQTLIRKCRSEHSPIGTEGKTGKQTNKEGISIR